MLSLPDMKSVACKCDGSLCWIWSYMMNYEGTTIVCMTWGMEETYRKITNFEWFYLLNCKICEWLLLTIVSYLNMLICLERSLPTIILTSGQSVKNLWVWPLCFGCWWVERIYWSLTFCSISISLTFFEATSKSPGSTRIMDPVFSSFMMYPFQYKTSP